MIVRISWPGASAQEVKQQVTDKLEKIIQEVPHLDYTNSYSRPGESILFIIVKDNPFSKGIPEVWSQVRKKVSDILSTLPQGVESLTFNDAFSDLCGSMYALTGDGFDYASLKKQAKLIWTERLKSKMLRKLIFWQTETTRIH